MSKYDTIVIGNGPAGISCAIYLKRYNLNPLVIGNGYGALINAHIENYYGIKSISGKDLVDVGIEQAKNLGIDVISEEVLSIDIMNNYIVKTTNNTYEAPTIFLGIGKSRKKANIKGIDNLEGKGVSYCATCDGFFYRNKRIGIIGSGNYMLHELSDLEKFSKDIIIFTNGEHLENTSFKVVSDKITEVVGQDKLEAVITSSGKYEIDGLFVAIGSASALSFSKHLGLLSDQQSNLVVNESFMTNIPGVFAGGDVVGGLLQVSKAVSDGANAAVSIKNYLKISKL